MIVIDNRTQQIVSDMLSSSELRRIARERLASLLDPRNAPQPGCQWYELPVYARVFNMTCARERMPSGLTAQEQNDWNTGQAQIGG